MRRIGQFFLVVCLIVAAAPFALTVDHGSGLPSAAAAAAAIDPALSTAIERLDSPAALDVIVTFWKDSDMALLDTLAPNTKLQALPSAYAKLTADQIRTVASWPEIRSVWDALERNEILLEQGRELVHANQVHAELGVTGEGITVAVIDTGIDATHPDLPFGDKVIENWEVLGFSALGLRGCVFASSENTDDDGHGTHVSGTIAGTGAASDGRFKGVAPGAKLVGYSTNVGIFILTASALCAYDDIIARTHVTGVRVVSNSWGGGVGGRYQPGDPISVAIERAFHAGIASVFAAGNSGPEENTMTSRFSVSPFAIGVGAITKPEEVVMFSSRGRPFDNHDRDVGLANNVGVYRPAVVAPGVRIMAPIAGGGYESLSGTSMATPHVSGVAALTLSANRALTPLQLVNVLEGTASAMGGYFAHEVGAGLANAFGAVTLAQQIAQNPATSIPPGQFARTPPAISRVDTVEFDPLVFVGPSTTAEPGSPDANVMDHFVDVGPNAVSLYVDIEWLVDADNFYIFLYRPGDDPATGFPAQEAAGLLDIPLVFRFADVRNPDPGQWRIRIMARLNVVDVVFTTALVAYGETQQETTTDHLGVMMQIRKSEKTAEPGDSLAYAIRLTNTGSVPTKFTIAPSNVPADWQATVKPTEATVNPGQTVLVQLVVKVPSSARDGSVGTIVVTATSVPAQASDGVVSSSVSTYTRVEND